MIASPKWLLLPYLVNILILVPVCYSLLFGNGMGSVFEGKVDDSEGLRLLVTSLWTAILLCSVAGLFAPGFFAPVLIIQIIYKSMWLMLFVLPLLTKGHPVPIGISVSFALIITTYPVFLFLAFKG